MRRALLSGDVASHSGIALKSKFTPLEDQQLLDLIAVHGDNDWSRIATLLGTRNARQCRDRYKNYLNPYLRQDDWAPEEDLLLLAKYAEFGAKWNKIARFFILRSDNSLRNRWQLLARRHAREAQKSPLTPSTLSITPLPVPTAVSAATAAPYMPNLPLTVQAPEPRHVVRIEQKPDLCLAGIFDFAEQMRNEFNGCHEDSFDSWLSFSRP